MVGRRAVTPRLPGGQRPVAVCVHCENRWPGTEWNSSGIGADLVDEQTERSDRVALLLHDVERLRTGYGHAETEDPAAHPRTTEEWIRSAPRRAAGNDRDNSQAPALLRFTTRSSPDAQAASKLDATPQLLVELEELAVDSAAIVAGKALELSRFRIRAYCLARCVRCNYEGSGGLRSISPGRPGVVSRDSMECHLRRSHAAALQFFRHRHPNRLEHDRVGYFGAGGRPTA